MFHWPVQFVDGPGWVLASTRAEAEEVLASSDAYREGEWVVAPSPTQGPGLN